MFDPSMDHRYMDFIGNTQPINTYVYHINTYKQPINTSFDGSPLHGLYLERACRGRYGVGSKPKRGKAIMWDSMVDGDDASQRLMAERERQETQEIQQEGMAEGTGRTESTKRTVKTKKQERQERKERKKTLERDMSLLGPYNYQRLTWHAGCNVIPFKGNAEKAFADGDRDGNRDGDRDGDREGDVKIILQKFKELPLTRRRASPITPPITRHATRDGRAGGQEEGEEGEKDRGRARTSKQERQARRRAGLGLGLPHSPYEAYVHVSTPPPLHP
jgi:hypothetical protein